MDSPKDELLSLVIVLIVVCVLAVIIGALGAWGTTIGLVLGLAFIGTIGRISVELVRFLMEPRAGRALEEYISIKIKAQDDDDPGYISLLQRLITKLDNQYDPEQVFVIQIKNWFDHKRLKLSDKGQVRLDHLRDWQPNVAFSEFFQDAITFPSFTPDRILSQTAYSISQTRRFAHNMKRKHSSWNLQKRVTQFSNSAIFIWYSSATRSNQRGSILVYIVKNGAVDAWYASFRKAISWRLDKTKGIDKNIVESMIEYHAEQNGPTDG